MGNGNMVQNVQPVRLPADILASVLRKLRIASNAKLTFERFPQLGKAAEGFAWHLSERVTFPLYKGFPTQVALLELCIKCGFEWMYFRLDQPGVSVRDVQTSFMAGMLYHAPEIVHVKVSIDGLQWDPFNDEALSDWLPRHPGALIETRDTNDTDLERGDPEIRMALMSRMLPNGGVHLMEINLPQVLFPSELIQPPKVYDGQ